MANYFLNENGSLTKNKKKKKGNSYVLQENGKLVLNPDYEEDLAPVKSEKKERTWFSSGAFEDGYDFGDVSKTILGTINDVQQDLFKGGARIIEGTIDTGAYIYGGASKILGNEDAAEKAKNFIKRDLIEETKVGNILASIDDFAAFGTATGEFIRTGDAGVYKDTAKALLSNDYYEENSVLGDKSDSLVQSAGQLGGTFALQAVGVPWFVTTGTTAFGGEVQEAFQEDATYLEAGGSGLVSAASEILFEKLSGGISFGSKTLDDLWKKPLIDKISNKTVKTLIKFGFDVVGEGGEEVATEIVSNVGKKLTYEDEKTWNEILWSEEALDSYLEAFIGGAVMGGGFNVGRTVNSIKTGRDYDTGLTDNEQKVYDQEVAKRTEGKELTKKQREKIEAEVKEDLQKGFISTDTIESTLGGDTYNSLKSTRDNKTNLETQIKELENKPNAEITVKEMEQLNDLREQLGKVDTNTLETQLQSEIGQKIKSDAYLQRSYQEKAKRNKEFTYEVAETDSEFRKGVLESTKGKLNDTTRSHETVEAVAKLSEDRQMQYKFTNNAELKELGLVPEGKTANGLYVVEKDGKREILVNTDSKKYIEAVLVHETAHDFQTTSPETYTKLVDITKEFAEAQGDYARVYSEVAGMYKNVKDAKIDEEVTSRLLEDYLGNKEFIESLTTKEPNIVKKIIDEIKYLVKKFTAGSPEARKLVELQHNLEKTYREAYKQTEVKTDAKEGTKYSLSEGNSYRGSHQIENAKKLTELDLNDIQNKVIEVNGSLSKQDYSDLNKLKKIFKTPNENVKIYRASPVHELNNGDWVTTDKSYAKNVASQNGGKVYEYEVNPSQLYYPDNVKELPSLHRLSSFQYIEDVDNTQYSLSEETDNQGRNLTEYTLEKTKNSKVRDENGKLMLMYHGSPNGTYNQLRAGTYFTSNKEYADGYQWEGASSISYGKQVNNPRTYEAYLNITNPFTLKNETAKNIYLNEYIKGGNSAYFDPYTDYTDTINNMDEIDWVEGVDLQEWILENHPEFDGMFLDEGGDGGYGGAEYRWRGYSAVPFSEEQIIKANNNNTEYSLSNESDIAPTSTDNQTATQDIRLEDIAPTKEKPKTKPSLLSVLGKNNSYQTKSLRNPVNKTTPTAIKEINGTEYQEYNFGRNYSNIEFGQKYFDTEVNEAVNRYVNRGEQKISDSEFAKEAAEMKKVSIPAPFDMVLYRGGTSIDNAMSRQAISSTFDYDVARAYAFKEKPANRQIQTIYVKKGTPITSTFNAVDSIKGERYEHDYWDKSGEIVLFPDSYNIQEISEGVYEVSGQQTTPVNTSDIDYAPAKQEVVEQQNSEAFNTIEDTDMPSEIEDTIPETEQLTPTDSLFDTRDYAEVGDRKIKAYQYENPEVRPFFQQAAREMLNDLHESVRGERYTIGDASQMGGGDYYFTGTKRYTTKDIAELLDGVDGKYKYTYEEIRKGLQAIIEDNGKENNAASKRIEFYLDKRLREGYTDLYGYTYPADAEYLDMLRAKGVSDYYSSLPIGEAPIEEASNTEVTEDIAPVRNTSNINDVETTDKGKQQHLNLNNLGETLQDNNVDWDSVENTSLENAKQLTIDGTEEDLVKKTKRELRQALLGTETQREFITDALDNAKNRSMAFMNNTDTIRNTELVFGRDAGRTINNLIFQKEIDNEADSIKWQNKERNKIKALGIKARSKESAAVQKYGEKQYVTDAGEVIAYGDAELAAEFPNVATQEKIKNAAKEIRSKYDNYIDLANGVLTKLGFDPIKKRNDYMRHFQELNDVFSRYGIPFNAQNMQEYVLPTDINGLTEFWSPQKNYFANMQARKGVKTTYDAITGVDGYISGISNLIFHTEDIQRGRAFEELIRETYGEDKGWDNLDNLPDELKQARSEKIQDNHLSNYAAWVHEWTNNIAGKKNKIDRSIEAVFGRKVFSFMDQVRKQVGSNMIGFNLSSSLTNLIAPVQAIAKTNKLAVAKGTADTIKNIFIKDNFMDNNKFLTSRMGTDMISKNAWQKMQDAGFVFMKGMDWFSSNQIVRSKYFELRAKGMSEAQAHAEAGQFAARILGDRTKGANAQIYNSKLLGLVTQFQLEVNNQLYSMFYDTYHESKENARNNAAKTAAGMTFTLGQLFAYTHIFGKTFEAVAGYNPTLDVIGILMTAFGWGDEDEDKTTSERLKGAFDQLIDSLPYVNVLTGGGRIPISSGIPDVIGVMRGGKDQYGNELTWEDELKKLLYLVPPTGGNQVKKTYQGLSMFDEDLPVSGSYTDSGNLRFPVEDTPLNKLQAGLFGQWASENARDYFDNERQPLKEKQIQEYKDLEMPIKDYWDYREGLKEQSTTQEKFDYINSLDATSDQKNIMINNAIDRKDAIDMSNYDDFGGYEEFDYATKNPDKYRVIEQIDTFDNYNSYKEDIASIKEQFSTDNGYDTKQRKAAVQQYIQSLNLDIPQKIMLEKMAGGYSIKSYEGYMYSYIESLPLSAEEKQAIHNELFN